MLVIVSRHTDPKSGLLLLMTFNLCAQLKIISVHSISDAVFSSFAGIFVKNILNEENNKAFQATGNSSYTRPTGRLAGFENTGTLVV